MLHETEVRRSVYELNALRFASANDVIDVELCELMRSAVAEAFEEDAIRWNGRHGKRYDLTNLMIDYAGNFIQLSDHEKINEIFSAAVSSTCVIHNHSATFLLPSRTLGAANLHVPPTRHVPSYNLA